MRLPIISRKKYEIVKNNLKIINDQRIKLAKSYEKAQLELITLKEQNKDLGVCLVKLDTDLKEYKKEIANLKRLLTKNGIKYKKEKSDK